ncbi:MAG: iron donor protein CyaY [Porticoccaceae bacterium]
MKESEFNALVDELMLALEEAIDESGVDIDYETSAGVMTLTVEANGSKVIISRQPALCQVWIAAKSGGYHCDYVDGEWVCGSTREILPVLLNRVLAEQLPGGMEPLVL